MTKEGIIKSALLAAALGVSIGGWTPKAESAVSIIEKKDPSFSEVQVAAPDLISLTRLNLISPNRIAYEPAQQDKPVEETRKNIQLLKGLPDQQLFIVMNFMRSSLGVSCAYCHVYSGGDNWAWETDDKPQKRTARRMIQMVRDINTANFNGAHRVSCYTCHRGETAPLTSPPLPQAPPEGGPGGMKAAVSLPTVEQVLDKYTQALGGRALLEKAKTRFMKGVQLSTNDTSAPVEISQKAPNKFVMIMTTPQAAVVSRGFNGSIGWMKTPRGQRELKGTDLAQVKRNADFNWMLNLKDLSREMKVTGKEKMGDHEVYVVEARIAPDKIEKLFFDTQMGLLLRDILLTDTMIGWIPEQTDYDDYKDVDGVKMPFTIRQSYVDPWVGWTRKLAEVKINVPVDDSKFEPPPATK
jgi:outer membrane lipoprotein-sorting protein